MVFLDCADLRSRFSSKVSRQTVDSGAAAWKGVPHHRIHKDNTTKKRYKLVTMLVRNCLKLVFTSNVNKSGVGIRSWFSPATEAMEGTEAESDSDSDCDSVFYSH